MKNLYKNLTKVGKIADAQIAVNALEAWKNRVAKNALERGTKVPTFAANCDVAIAIERENRVSFPAMNYKA